MLFYKNMLKMYNKNINFLGKKGLEPLTLRLSSVYSNQLSYLPFIYLSSDSFLQIKKQTPRFINTDILPFIHLSIEQNI